MQIVCNIVLHRLFHWHMHDISCFSYLIYADCLKIWEIEMRMADLHIFHYAFCCVFMIIQQFVVYIRGTAVFMLKASEYVGAGIFIQRIQGWQMYHIHDIFWYYTCSWYVHGGGWGCEVSCGGHHRPRGKTTTGSALDGAVFDIAQILAYLIHNMSRSHLYLGFGHFGWLPSFFDQ